MTIYIAAVGHDYSAEKDFKAGTMEECVKYVHEFFKSYDFEVINGQPWDGGNSSITAAQADSQPNDDGFTCFSNVTMEVINGEDLIAGFSHCDGDGPCASISESD